MDLIGCYGVYTNICKWLKNEDEQHIVLIGSSGCGKTALIQSIITKLSSKINFIQFDCSSRLNKKIVTEKIDKYVSNKNVVDIMIGEEKKTVCVFDEIEGTIECENMSYIEIVKFLTNKNIVGIFISSNKGVPKLQEVIKVSHLCKLGPYNKKDVLRFLVQKHNDLDVNRTKQIIEECGDDVRKIIECVEYKTDSNKEQQNSITDSKAILNVIIQSDIDSSIRLIESDVMNIIFTIHENYHIMSDDLLNHMKVLKCLSQVDSFQQSMFEHQNWTLNAFSYTSLYHASTYLKPTKKVLKTGTMWSKCSNWQYKKKLYNNFAYTRPNCLFHNMTFVYSLKSYLLDLMINDRFEECVDILNKLNMTKDDFEQLLRISDVDGRKSEFKGVVKNKLIKALKST